MSVSKKVQYVFQAKCYKYWPGSEGQQQQIFGRINVKALSEMVTRSCTVRAFSIFTVRSSCHC